MRDQGESAIKNDITINGSMRTDTGSGKDDPVSDNSAVQNGVNASMKMPTAADLTVLAQVPMTVHVEVGRTTMTLGEILSNVDVGTSIKLDRRAGDPVEVYVNGTLFARAEVVVIQDQIAAKIIEIVDGVREPRPSGLR